MKFGKSLGIQIEETLPEWRDKFLSYKGLKKRLKLIDPPPSDGPPPAKRPRPPPAAADACPPAMTVEEEGFMTLLEGELEKFNTFFVEKEEEYIIRQKELQDRLRTAKDLKEEMMVRKEIVDFHGEMVLLENYSALNYTGLVKILKKYDKRTGALMRLPFIQKVLQQPFFTTDLLNKLIKECERMLDGLFLPPPADAPSSSPPSPSATRDQTADASPKEDGDRAGGGRKAGRMPELEEIEYIESLYMKSTLAALRVLKDIRSGSSTVSVFSLPPLQSTGEAEGNRWRKVPVLEQTAE